MRARYTPRALDPSEARAIDPLVEHVQLNQDPLVSQLVIGTPQKFPFPGDSLLTPISVPNWVFEYTVFNTEHLDTVDTRRAMRAPIKHGDWKASTVADKCERYSFSVPKDDDELSNAHPSLSIREKSALLAKRMVLMDIERTIMTLVTTTANYAVGYSTTLGGGSEWDAAGGDSLTDIRTGVDAICGGLPVAPEDLVVFLPQASLEAAKRDPTLAAIRANYESKMPSTEVLRDYWGVGRVWTANPVDKTAAGVVGPMYPDCAIIYYPGDNAAYDTSYGDITWAVNFKFRRGIVQRPYYKEDHTTWYFPFHDYAAPRVINDTAAYLILNCAA